MSLFISRSQAYTYLSVTRILRNRLYVRVAACFLKIAIYRRQVPISLAARLLGHYQFIGHWCRRSSWFVPWIRQVDATPSNECFFKDGVYDPRKMVETFAYP